MVELPPGPRRENSLLNSSRSVSGTKSAPPSTPRSSFWTVRARGDRPRRRVTVRPSSRKGGRDVPAGQLRALGGKLPLGGGGVQRGALLKVLYALAELLGGAVAGDPLGLGDRFRVGGDRRKARLHQERAAEEGFEAVYVCPIHRPGDTRALRKQRRAAETGAGG